ncbi:MAG: amidase [Candidatus Thiodiazotropha sp.]
MNTRIDLSSVTLETLNQLMDSRELSSVDLCSMCLQQIANLDGYTNAVTNIDPDALDYADRLDKERRSGVTRGVLHGIPIFVKDNIDTVGNLPTTAGSLALAGNFTGSDADVVRSLRMAGAVVLGKTNMSEWCNFRSDRASSGWSSVAGQTKNAYSLTHSPGGSSSGSAVAASVGMCVAAVGTETDGSLVGPASMNALVGIKPTIGTLSQRGIITLSHSYDTAGPLARSVIDAALMLNCMRERSGKSSFHRAMSLSFLPAFARKDGLKGKRIGFVEAYRELNEDEEHVIHDAIHVLRENGAIPVEGVVLEHLDRLEELCMNVICYEFKHGLASYLSNANNQTPIKTLSDIIRFNENNADQVMPFFGQERLVRAQAEREFSNAEYLSAKEEIRRLTCTSGVDRTMREHRLDALAARTIGRAWEIDLEAGDDRSPGAATWAALAGYPSVSIPAGYIDGLPIGLLIFGRAYSEEDLLTIAYAFEQATKTRRPPQWIQKDIISPQ